MAITKDQASDLISLQQSLVIAEKALQMSEQALQMSEIARNIAAHKLANFVWELQQVTK